MYSSYMATYLVSMKFLKMVLEGITFCWIVIKIISGILLLMAIIMLILGLVVKGDTTFEDMTAD